MKPRIHYRDLGHMPYAEAWALQEQLLAQNVALKLAAPRHEDPRLVPTTHHLLFCEHPHVYTLGKSGDMAHLLASEAELEALGATFFRINRGGDITYHGPGQITGYPILDLDHFKPDIHWYLRALEEAVIQYLAALGLRAGRSPGQTGVWLHTDTPTPRKICALGVRLSRWVTMHGFAFNVNTDLRYFGHIVPCGIADKGVTSLAQELGHPMDMDTVKRDLRAHLAHALGGTLVE